MKPALTILFLLCASALARNHFLLTQDLGQEEASIIPAASISIVTTDIPLHWPPSPEEGAADGYNVYFGNASNRYSDWIEVGHVTNTMLTLPTGLSWHLNVTTRPKPGDTYWAESDFPELIVDSTRSYMFISAEAVVNSPLKLNLFFPNGGGIALQSSRDLKKWAPRAGLFSDGQWHVTAIPGVPREFFRAVY